MAEVEVAVVAEVAAVLAAAEVRLCIMVEVAATKVEPLCKKSNIGDTYISDGETKRVTEWILEMALVEMRQQYLCHDPGMYT